MLGDKRFTLLGPDVDELQDLRSGDFIESDLPAFMLVNPD